MFCYYVSYACTNRTDFGFGSCEIRLYEPITSTDHIIEIQNQLEKENRGMLGKVIVLNYILMREEPVGE